jgi:hypothetical protein
MGLYDGRRDLFVWCRTYGRGVFDGSLPEVAELAALSDAAVVDAVSGWARVESAACARKQAALAEQFARRTGLGAGDRESWWIDPEAAVSAELAAALNVSAGMALHQTHRGVALRDRLPRVAQLFEAGVIGDLLVRAIVWRTYLIDDVEAMAKVDAALAEQVRGWGPLSVAKTEQAIDALVQTYDPGAVRRSRSTVSSRDVQFGSRHDEAGLTSVWARMFAGDAAVFKARVQEIAQTVCEADPRTAAERRSDALTALGAGHDALVCGCGDPDCPAAGGQGAASPVSTVVHVVADAVTMDVARRQSGADEPDPTDPPDPEPGPTHPPGPGPTHPPGPGPTDPVDPVAPASDAATDEHEPAAAAQPETVAEPDPAACAPVSWVRPGFVMGGGIVPTPLLAAMLGRARVREIHHPGQAGPEPGYRPSARLAEFARCRDLTCRWPGCDKPADRCDLDHTVPYPLGPTHASNIKCLCRFHHLMKTFWGWSDRQFPDGTVVWTTSAGHTYTTHPGSLQLFPTLCEPTATLWSGEPPVPDEAAERGAMMPKRRHTRAENRARAAAAERRLNDPYVAERNKPPPF